MLATPPAYYQTAPVQHMSYGGRDRTYRVYRPANLSRKGAVPLVVMLHGGFGTGAQAEKAYGWDESANKHGFVVIYPDGIGRSWNAGECCGPALRGQVDDVGFLDSLIQRISAQQHIDPSRIAITGMSNGAMMAYRMACDSRAKLRVIGSVSGTLVTACLHPQQTNVIEIHGTADQNIPFNGGKGHGPTGVVTVPIPQVLARWRNIDDCGAPQTTISATVTRESATCAQHRTVELITIAGAGHQWPQSQPPPPEWAALAQRLGIHGLDAPSQALNATETLYAFFFGQTSR